MMTAPAVREPSRPILPRLDLLNPLLSCSMLKQRIETLYRVEIASSWATRRFLPGGRTVSRARPRSPGHIVSRGELNFDLCNRCSPSSACEAQTALSSYLSG